MFSISDVPILRNFICPQGALKQLCNYGPIKTSHYTITLCAIVYILYKVFIQHCKDRQIFMGISMVVQHVEIQNIKQTLCLISCFVL